MAVFFAAYSEYFYSNQNMVLKLLRFPHTFAKYLLSPERLSRRLISIYDDTSIHFVKTLMSMFEHPVYRVYQEMTESHIAVNEVFKIYPEPLKLQSERNGGLIEIPVSRSNSGIDPITCRLLSARRRKGKVSNKKNWFHADYNLFISSIRSPIRPILVQMDFLVASLFTPTAEVGLHKVPNYVSYAFRTFLLIALET